MANVEVLLACAEGRSLLAVARELKLLRTTSATAMLINSPTMAALAIERLLAVFMHCRIRMTHSFRGIVSKARQTSATKHEAVLPFSFSRAICDVPIATEFDRLP